MTSKHYRWQTRWQLDRTAGTATHDCGLVVRFAADTGPDGQPANGLETLAALAVKNGPHNAPNMLRRLLKEAAELYNQAPNHAHR